MAVSIMELSPAALAALSVKRLSKVSLKDISRYFYLHKNTHLGVIYSYTNKIDGRRYIGQTRSPRSRDHSHRYYSLKTEARGCPHLPFNAELINYGIDYFEYNVLKICYAQTDRALRTSLDYFEERLIRRFRAINPLYGYNLLQGGVAGNTGKRCLSSIPVIQYDKNGNFIKEFGSVCDVERELSICKVGIYAVLKKKQRTAGGFLWTKKGESLDPANIVHANRGIIHRYTIDGEYVDTFHSISGAARAVKGNMWNIQECAKPPHCFSAYGYRWSRIKHERLDSPPPVSKIEIHAYNSDGLYVTSYDSIAAALRAQKLNRSDLPYKDTWRKAGGYYWRTFKADRIEIPTSNRKGYGK